MPSQRVRLPLAGVILLYLTFVLFRASTAQPWNDEAWYTAPSLNLILHGNTGTPYLETAHKFWRGINHITYWVVPLQFFAQVPWIELFGFSLLKMRLFAAIWGLVAMLSWTYAVANLTGKASLALLAAFLIACDYQFVSQMSLVRMDAMALGLASLGFALYLCLRAEYLSFAIFTATLCAVGCGLTHPTAGVPATTGLLFLTFYLDRHKLRFKHLIPFTIPFFLGALFWGWYISYDPELFKAQFFGNVTDIDRLGGFTHPFRAIWREMLRFWGMSGFVNGMHPLYKIKAIPMAMYAVAIVWLLCSRKLREATRSSALIGLWLTYAITMTFYENTKEVKYGVHIVALYDVALALIVYYLWSRFSWKRIAAVITAALFLGVNIGGILFTSWFKDDLHNAYLPTASYLRSHSRPDDLILVGSEFGFALGFDRANTIDDNDLTFYTHKSPAYIVMSNGYRSILGSIQTRRPDIYQYFVDLLNRSYHRVFTSGEYEIFQKNS